MSSFTLRARNKETGEMHEVWCLDDYFGKHQYGYIPNNTSAPAMTENQFYKYYEVEDQHPRSSDSE